MIEIESIHVHKWVCGSGYVDVDTRLNQDGEKEWELQYVHMWLCVGVVD